MCGIWFCMGKLNKSGYSCVEKLENRGPESMRYLKINDLYMGFTRLAINGIGNNGMQPFEKDGIYWMCNGEIYNWKNLVNMAKLESPNSQSDCEILGNLYQCYKNNLSSYFRSLDGVFALIILDTIRGLVIVGRDPYGVRPLYKGYGLDGNIYFASEIKSIFDRCYKIIPFNPGSYEIWDIKTKSPIEEKKYHEVPWIKNPLFSSSNPTGLDLACASLRFGLEEAVKKRMLTERPIAALLSGGIDSSLIASLVQKNLRELGLPPLKTFSIGMPGSSDIQYAKMVAQWIKSDHTEIILTSEKFFEAIPEVISAIESFDTTTVRASVGNWLICREIRKTECRVVFNGDGSDEIFGSYLYFYNAPNEISFEEESDRLLRDMHLYDIRRSDGSISSHGLEARTPFLDKQFVAIAKSIDTKYRQPTRGKQVEKWILRKAFDDGETLPKDIIWRRKEAFSDGVSSAEKSWYEEIQEKVKLVIPSDWKTKISDDEKFYMNHLIPITEEQYYYRTIYIKLYGSIIDTVPYFWMPKWVQGVTDPSARTLCLYTEK